MEYRLFIGGVFRDGTAVREVRMPYDGTVFANAHVGDGQFLDEAVMAARRGFQAMRAMTG